MTARFRHVRELPCSPEEAWAWLTDPELMNEWSTAPIALSSAGVGDRADGVGALRTVTLPTGGTKLREVVEVSEFPHRFVYRVHDGGPLLLNHRGEQVIEPADSGCRVTWTVDMHLVGGLSKPFAKLVGKQVGESLDKLRSLSRSKSRTPLVEPVEASSRPVSLSKRDLSELKAAAEASRDEQKQIADELAASNDPKQWFARVYQYVTEEMIAVATAPAPPVEPVEARGPKRLLNLVPEYRERSSSIEGRTPLVEPVEASSLDNPDWVLALIPTFHDYFTKALRQYQAGEECRGSWQKAWSICERDDPKHPERPVMRGLLAGVSAHIDTDLPDALLDVHRESYADRDLREFRPDYLRLAPVFTAASDRLLADLPSSHKPWWTPVATKIHPKVRDELLGRQGYHVGKHRLKAFERAIGAQSVD